jgi:integrase
VGPEPQLRLTPETIRATSNGSRLIRQSDETPTLHVGAQNKPSDGCSLAVCCSCAYRAKTPAAHCVLINGVAKREPMEIDVILAAHAPALTRLADRTRAFLAAAKACSTQRAYRGDWSHFEEWCRGLGLTALPAKPETVALYITGLASSHRPTTLRRRLTVISRAHQAAGHPSPASMQQPLVSETLKGIRRTVGTAERTKRPLYTEQLRAMIRARPDSLQGIRDRALLLVGFAGGLRRSELAGLTLENLASENDGLVILLSRSKTDQEGKGRKVALPYGSSSETCPVRACRNWIDAAGISDGPLFSGNRPPWPHTWPSLTSRFRRHDRQTCRRPHRARSGGVRWPQPSRRSRHSGIPQRRQRTRDHAADRPSFSGDGP